MARRFFRRVYPVLEGAQDGEIHFLVDWDIPRGTTNETHAARRRAYRRLAEYLGANVSDCTSSESVIAMATIEEAREVAKIVSEGGGTAHVRTVTVTETYGPTHEDKKEV